MAINTATQEDHLFKIKLMVMSTDDFTDEQVERAFLDTNVESEDDIVVITECLEKFRPRLCQKLLQRYQR